MAQYHFKIYFAFYLLYVCPYIICKCYKVTNAFTSVDAVKYSSVETVKFTLFTLCLLLLAQRVGIYLLAA